jgi:anti-sigma factor RsiW
MNGMNDQRFHDLAMKVLARQATDADRVELDSLLAGNPQLKAEFARLRVDVRIGTELLPVVAATEATAPEFPAYARERLQTKVRQSLGANLPSAKEAESARGWVWRLWLGLATVTAVIVTMLIPSLVRPSTPLIQVAMLDTTGATRGDVTNEVAVLQEMWRKSAVQNFTYIAELETWEKAWPGDTQRVAAKIIYDRAAGEVRVLVHRQQQIIQKSFTVDSDLTAAVQQAKAFIEEQIRR